MLYFVPRQASTRGKELGQAYAITDLLRVKLKDNASLKDMDKGKMTDSQSEQNLQD